MHNVTSEPQQFEYNTLQKELLEEFINCGGNLITNQLARRGDGYSTFVVAQCIQQALHGRDVVFVGERKSEWNTLDVFAGVAKELFNLDMKWNKPARIIQLGDVRIRLLHQTDYPFNNLRGIDIDDVFADISSESWYRNFEYFDILLARMNRGGHDGTGMKLINIW